MRKICLLVTGNFDVAYNRTAIVLAGLAHCKNEVEVHVFPFQKQNKTTARQLRVYASKIDAVYLPPFTHADVRFVKKHTQKPLFFDPLISKYLTKVFDYQQVNRYSPRALKNWWKDKSAMTKADFVLADTEAHRQYFIDKFSLPAEKVGVLPIGSQTDIFKPNFTTNTDINTSTNSASNSPFRIGFYGGFIPLQGTLEIVEAAAILHNENCVFELVGTGFQWEKAKALARAKGLENITFPGWVSHELLGEKINTYDLCLGIFGATQKTDLVIPNKVWHYAACGKCILTKDTPAIREAFTNGENIVWCAGKSDAMAEAILTLKKATKKRTTIGRKAHQLVSEKYDEKAIGKALFDFLTIKLNAN